MILYLLDFLKDFGIHVPSVFGYVSTRMMCAAVTALLISIFWGPRFIKKLYEWKIGQSIRTEDCPLLGKLHEKKKDTPTMGGVLIIFAILASMVLWSDWSQAFTWLLAFTAGTLACLGGYDDYLKLRYRDTKGLSARKKLLIQGLVSLLVVAYLTVPAISTFLEQSVGIHAPYAKDADGVYPVWEYSQRLYFPFFKEPLLWFVGSALSFVVPFFMMFVITGASNAVNLTDGLDGLASGLLVLVAAALAIVAFVSNNLYISNFLNILYIDGSGEIAVFLCALAGASLGFLWYNCPPAQVFMGDTGSLALGGVIGVAAVLLKREFLLGIVGALFVAEALSVILQVLSYRYRDKKRIFLCAPLHHHFEYKGWPETKVVIRFWIIGLLMAIIGIASLKFQ